MNKFIIALILCLVITLSVTLSVLPISDDTANLEPELVNSPDQYTLETECSYEYSGDGDGAGSDSRITSSKFSNNDLNNNRVHDSLDSITETKCAVFVHYDHLPAPDDVDRLTSHGIEVNYVSKYVNVIQTFEIPLKFLELITNLPGVVYIEPVPDYKLTLDNSARAVKARESSEYSPDTAEDLGYSGRGINIAMLDTGVDDDHPSLAGKFIAGADFAGGTGQVTPKNGRYNPDDEIGHGTSTAGIAMGTGDPDGLYRGIAPDASLIDVRVTLGRGGTVLAGVEWCLDNVDTDWNNNGLDEYDGIDVVSISIGGADDADGTSPTSQVINQLVDAGVVVVTAVGNDGPNNQGISDVAAADKAITSGNLDILNTVDRSDDEVHRTSSTGPRRDDGDGDPNDELKPDVVAPGIDITAPRYSIIGQRGNGYESYSGSSMSCPHVSGICALMLEANPDLKPKDIKTILHSTAEAMGDPSLPELSAKYNFTSGYGSVDAYEAVLSALDYSPINHAPEISSVTASPMFVKPAGQANITTKAYDSDGDTLSYKYELTGGTIAGTGSEVTWTAPNQLGEYEIKVTVSDGEFTSDPVSVIITVEEEPGNHQPEIEKIDAVPTEVEPSGSATITVTATDPDGDDLFYEYDATDGEIIGTGSKVVWSAPNRVGKYTITITVSDGKLSVDADIVIEVLGNPENRAPVIESFTADSSRVETNDMALLQVVATDPDGDELQYSYTVTAGTLQGSGPNINWRAPNDPGKASIEVTVTDPGGLTDTEYLIIDVYLAAVPPEILEKNAYPKVIINDGSVEALFTVKISDGNGLDDIMEVLIDLSAIAGPEKQKMYDNGKHGDQNKDDGIFSVSYLVPKSLSSGDKRLSVQVRDRTNKIAKDEIDVNLQAVKEEEPDEGLVEEYLGIPGFESGILLIATIILLIVMVRRRRKGVK